MDLGKQLQAFVSLMPKGMQFVFDWKIEDKI